MLKLEIKIDDLHIAKLITSGWIWNQIEK